jgi:hypothetical protein
MYRCDVVYGTTSEFGFDYLRDNMKRSVEQQVQRKREFAIVDEVDSILIDEARTPLIISGPRTRTSPGTTSPTSSPGTSSRSRSPGTSRDRRSVQAADQGPGGRHPPGPRQERVPDLQKQLEAAKQSCPTWRPSATSTCSTTRSRMDRKQAT